MAAAGGEQNPTWYKDAVIYELHVRAFCDGNDDGIGDLQGLIGKLDYLHNLGITALWLLPFYPSPLKDDGYDIADYTDVHPDYGTVRDFKRLLEEAHRRGLRVITELVLNHTSDRHPWFQRARRAPAGSAERDFYVWSDTPERYQGARVIFRDFEPSNWSWDPVAEAYYWHRFYAHQPDLNYDNPAVREAILGVVDFWLELGVDGLRLDAVPYLFEAEHTSSENLPLTHAFLKELRQHIDARYSNRMLLAEANQWPEEAVAYFGAGDECHMAFHFPLMPRLYLAIRAEDRLPIVDILAQTPPIPETCQWALFLRNHDELTLEMVSDEERLYLYRAFARDPEARINLGIRRRLAPLLGNDRRRIELLNALLCSLPGTPVIYYGDEIGMGDNVYLGDRDGVRTPMQWSSDRNAGFSRAHPQRLFLPLIVDYEFHHAVVQVEAQQQNPHSLLNWMRRLLAVRRRHQAFGWGSLETLDPANPAVLAFVRHHAEDVVLVVANLSRFVQAVALDLGRYRGLVPVELFGRTPFREIGDCPYELTLGPHAFYWFALQPQTASTNSHPTGREVVPSIAVNGAWEELVRGEARHLLEAALPDYLRTTGWFAGHGRRILGASIVESVAVPDAAMPTHVAFVRIEYANSEPETYLMPLSATRAWEDPPEAVIARIGYVGADGPEEGELIDATWTSEVPQALLALVTEEGHPLPGIVGDAAPSRFSAPRQHDVLAAKARPELVNGELNHTSVVFADQVVMKLLRRIEEGPHPEVEIGAFLTERQFPHAPPLLGAIVHRAHRGGSTVLAVLHQFVPNQGTAWPRMLDILGDYLDRAVATDRQPSATGRTGTGAAALLELAEREPPPLATELFGPSLDWARLLGRRTAELHQTLAADGTDPAFAPEPTTSFAQRSLHQAMRALTLRTFRALRLEAERLPEPTRREAHRLLRQEGAVLARSRPLVERRFEGVAIRCHGDYHLDQILLAGDDISIIDFEGEPSRHLTERRLKRPALRDVASMLRSFHYVADVALADRAAAGRGEAAEADPAPWASFWRLWCSAAFLRAYLDTVGPRLVPPSREERATLLDAFLLEKAVYELGHELRTRPSLIGIPLRGVLEILDTPAAGAPEPER